MLLQILRNFAVEDRQPIGIVVHIPIAAHKDKVIVILTANVKEILSVEKTTVWETSQHLQVIGQLTQIVVQVVRINKISSH